VGPKIRSGGCDEEKKSPSTRHIFVVYLISFLMIGFHGSSHGSGQCVAVII